MLGSRSAKSQVYPRRLGIALFIAVAWCLPLITFAASAFKQHHRHSDTWYLELTCHASQTELTTRSYIIHTEILHLRRRFGKVAMLEKPPGDQLCISLGPLRVSEGDAVEKVTKQIAAVFPSLEFRVVHGWPYGLELEVW